MKKIIAMLAVIFLLSACGSETATIDQQEQVKDQKSIETEENEHVEEKVQEEIDKEEAEELGSDKVEASAPLYKMNEKIYSFEPIADANPKVALLTIDDAPDTYALEMAKTLKALDAPAIFFVNGHFLQGEEKEEILKQIHELGFPIGNHTYSHKDLKTLTEEEQREEIISVNDMVEKIIGERPVFFRAPFGSNTDVSREIALEENMLLMNWTYGYDWEKEYMDKDAIANIMVNAPELADGANLLIHDRKWTSEGLEQIVQGLRDKGYELLDPKLIETPSAE